MVANRRMRTALRPDLLLPARSRAGEARGTLVAAAKPTGRTALCGFLSGLATRSATALQAAEPQHGAEIAKARCGAAPAPPRAMALGQERGRGCSDGVTLLVPAATRS